MMRWLGVILIFCGLALSAQQPKAGVLGGDDLKVVVPSTYFFRGQSAPVQLRNSAGFSGADGKLVLAGLVDTSGYASDVQAKYQGFLITEVKLRIEGTSLAPGEYGFGFSKEGKFLSDGCGSQRPVQRCGQDRRQTATSGASEGGRRRRLLPALCRPEVGHPKG